MIAALFYELHDFFEDVWFCAGDFGEHFAVKCHFFEFQGVDKGTILQARLAGCRVYLHVPLGAIVALFCLAAAEGVCPGVQQRFPGGPLFRFPAPAETFGIGEDFSPFFIGVDAPFDSWHIFL